MIGTWATFTPVPSCIAAATRPVPGTATQRTSRRLPRRRSGRGCHCNSCSHGSPGAGLASWQHDVKQRHERYRAAAETPEARQKSRQRTGHTCVFGLAPTGRLALTANSRRVRRRCDGRRAAGGGAVAEKVTNPSSQFSAAARFCTELIRSLSIESIVFTRQGLYCRTAEPPYPPGRRERVRPAVQRTAATP
jgi:hypothetical protein